MIKLRRAPLYWLSLLIASHAAHGAGDKEHAGSSLAPDYLTRHAALIIEEVDIDDLAQQEIILQLIDDYDVKCRRSRDTLAAKIRNLPRSGIDNKTMLESLAATEAFLQKKADDSLWLRDNIRLILTPEQQPKFQSALRRITRQRLIPKGSVPGANVDLIISLSNTADGRSAMQLSEVIEILNKWSLDIDQALSDREAFDVSNGIAFRTLIEEERWQDALDWRTAWLASHLRVRDVTIQATRDLLPFLDSSSARQLSIDVLQGGVNGRSRFLQLAENRLTNGSDYSEEILDATSEFNRTLKPLWEQLIELQLAVAGLQHLRPLQYRLGNRSDMDEIESEVLNIMLEIRRIDDQYIAYLESLPAP